MQHEILKRTWSPKWFNSWTNPIPHSSISVAIPRPIKTPWTNKRYRATTTANCQNSQLIRISPKISIHFIHKESIQIMHPRKGLIMIQISRMLWELPTFLKLKESHQRIRSCHQVLGCRAARIVSRLLRKNSRSLRPTMIPSWRWTPR